MFLQASQKKSFHSIRDYPLFVISHYNLASIFRSKLRCELGFVHCASFIVNCPRDGSDYDSEHEKKWKFVNLILFRQLVIKFVIKFVIKYHHQLLS